MFCVLCNLKVGEEPGNKANLWHKTFLILLGPACMVLLDVADVAWVNYEEKCWHFMQWSHKHHPDMQLWSLVIVAKIDSIKLSLQCIAIQQV